MRRLIVVVAVAAAVLIVYTSSWFSRGSGHNSDIFPYFLRHARKVFPHLECLDELKAISDLTEPPNW